MIVFLPTSQIPEQYSTGVLFSSTSHPLANNKMDQSAPDSDLSTIPFKPPPAGQSPDFTKRSELLTPAIAVCSIMLFLEVLFLCLRICTRLARDERWRLEDCRKHSRLAALATHGYSVLAIVTVLFSVALVITIVISVQTIGRHTWDISIGFLSSAWPSRVSQRTLPYHSLTYKILRCSC